MVNCIIHSFCLHLNIYSFITWFVTVDELQDKLLETAGRWRADDVDVVIEYFRSHPHLWDTSLVEYKNKTARNVAMEELSKNISYRKSGN